MHPQAYNLSRNRNQSPILQAVERQAVPSANTRFLEDMLQVDLHGTGADAEFGGDVLALEALLHQFQHLLLPRSQFAAGIAVAARGVAEDAVFHPTAAKGDGAQTGHDHRDARRFSEDSAPARRKRSASASVTETPQMTIAVEESCSFSFRPANRSRIASLPNALSRTRTSAEV